jgi:hypothetical protein
MHKDQGLDLSGHQQGDKLAKSFLAVIHAAAYVGDDLVNLDASGLSLDLESLLLDHQIVLLVGGGHSDITHHLSFGRLWNGEPSMIAKGPVMRLDPALPPPPTDGLRMNPVMHGYFACRQIFAHPREYCFPQHFPLAKDAFCAKLESHTENTECPTL